MAANSTRRLDIIAQYWQLLASPNDPRSGDYGYSQHQMQEFGAHQGAALYQALDDAADRNVSVRCVSVLCYIPCPCFRNGLVEEGCLCLLICTRWSQPLYTFKWRLMQVTVPLWSLSNIYLRTIQTCFRKAKCWECDLAARGLVGFGHCSCQSLDFWW